MRTLALDNLHILESTNNSTNNYSIIIDIIRKGLETDHVLQYIGFGPSVSINQHLLSDHVTGTFSKSKDICLVLGFLWCYVTCLRGMDINMYSLGTSIYYFNIIGPFDVGACEVALVKNKCPSN